MDNNATYCLSLLTNLLEFSVGREFSEQMEIARELFAVATGKVTDEDPFYDNRMMFFQHFFLFEFRLSNIFSGSTVFETFLVRAEAELPKEKLWDYEEFRSTRRSLFKVESVTNNSITVTDLLSNKLEEVLALPDYCFAGFSEDRVFDARLVSFHGQNYFTGTFVFHTDEVRDIIIKHIKNFLQGRTVTLSNRTLDWRSELKKRHEVISALAEQKKFLENGEKKKSVEVLNVSKNLAQISMEFDSSSLVMALGNNEEVSAFVPETPFYDSNILLNTLAYCELRCHRYKHILPEKLYSFDKRDLNSIPPPRSLQSLAPQEK